MMLDKLKLDPNYSQWKVDDTLTIDEDSKTEEQVPEETDEPEEPEPSPPTP